MCQTIHVDDVLEALLDDWDDQSEVDNAPHTQHRAAELPTSSETPDDAHLEFIRAVRHAKIQEVDAAAIQAVHDGLFASD